MRKQFIAILLALAILLCAAAALGEEQLYQIGKATSNKGIVTKTYPNKITLKVGSKLLGMGLGRNVTNLMTPTGITYKGGDGSFRCDLFGSKLGIVEVHSDPTISMAFLVAKAPGTVWVRAFVMDDSGNRTKIKSNKIKITVKKNINVKSLKLDTSKLKIYTADGPFNLGEIPMTVRPAVADDRGPDGKIPLTWTSSNPAVASVSGEYVTGIKAGKAVLTAQGSGKKAKINLTVVEGDIKY